MSRSNIENIPTCLPIARQELIGEMHVALPNGPNILELFNRARAPFFEEAETHRAKSRTHATLPTKLLSRK